MSERLDWLAWRALASETPTTGKAPATGSQARHNRHGRGHLRHGSGSRRTPCWYLYQLGRRQDCVRVRACSPLVQSELAPLRPSDPGLAPMSPVSVSAIGTPIVGYRDWGQQPRQQFVKHGRNAITGIVTQPRDHRPGRALRAADLERDITLECSSSGRCQCDVTPFRVASEVAACARF